MSPSEPANTPPDRGPEISEAYFSSPDLVQRADLLRHLTENSNLIPLVRGVEGIGKSTFIGHLLDLAPQNWMTVEIKADVMLQPEALLAKLARLYGLNDAAEGLLEGLAVHFDHLRQDGFLPVIVIDDAELLPEASIITLLRLHQQGPNDDPLAQILLFAQREIDSLLKTPQLKAMNLQPVQLLDMPLFTREQTEHFLEHLLAANESIHLSPAQAEKIFRETRGMPGLIKRRAAELTDSQETKRITFDVIEYLPIRTAIGGGIALLVVLLGLVYQDSINSMFTSNDGAPEVGQDALVAAGRTQPLALPSLTDESVSVLEEAGVEGARLSAPHSMGAAVVDPGGEQPVESMPVAGVDQAPLAAEPDVGEHQAQEEGSAAPVEEADPAKTETESTAERVAAPELAEVPEPEPVEHKEMESSGTEPEQAVTAGQEDSAAAEVAVPPSVLSGPASTATSSVAKLEPKTELSEVDADKAEMVPEPSQVKAPDVRPQAEPVTPKVKKTAVPIETVTKLVKPKVGKPVTKGTAGVKTPVVAAQIKVPGPAPVVRVEGRSSGPARARSATPAPVEERSTILVEKQVPAVRLTQKLEATAGNAPAASDRRPPAKDQKTGSSAPLREDWLLKQNPSSYTIQLVGLQAERGISSFLRRHPLAGRVAYYRTKRNGKPWFPVLFELYPDKKKAAQARDKLPESLRKSGAWLRIIGSVQKEIRAK